MLVLASQSPRRAAILEQAGIRFSVRFASVLEQREPGESPESYVRRLALDKARAVSRAPREIVLAADTIVVAGAEVLEKPSDIADAARMLEQLSGRVHRVITAICLRHDEGELVDAASTEVVFSPMSAQEIAYYAASGEPMDKAGAYAIQGLASRFIERIDGCYFNVVGLPVSLVYRRLKEIPGSAQLFGDAD